MQQGSFEIKNRGKSWGQGGVELRCKGRQKGSRRVPLKNSRMPKLAPEGLYFL